MIDRDRFNYMIKYIEDCSKHEVFPGAAFGIVTKAESVFHAVGYSQLFPVKEKADINTIYDLASLSKVISTTTIILKLIEDGRITLFTKVRDLLPEFRHNDITIYSLLTHTSGLPSDIDYKNFKNKNDIINQIYSTNLQYAAGEKVLYSDLGFILLGLIIEKIEGSIEGYFKRHIAEPLNMIDTGYNPEERAKLRCAASEYKKARGYVKGVVHDGKAFLMDGISGHAGLFSTVKDLGNFCSMMLNGGRYGDIRILHGNSIKILSQCHTGGLNEKRGLGWQLKDADNSVGDLASDNSIFHTGFSGTSVLIDFQNEFAFILLTNRIHPSRENTSLLKLRANINNIAETIVV